MLNRIDEEWIEYPVHSHDELAKPEGPTDDSGAQKTTPICAGTIEQNY